MYGKGVRAALVADQQRVALGEVARAVGALEHRDQAAVGVLRVAGRDALGDDRALRVLADVDHLGAGVGLLVVVGQRDRVELADRVVALQDAAGVLPGDRRAGLDLGPGDLRVAAGALAALGHEVVDAALAVLVAGVPVLHRRVLDLGVVEGDQLDHRGVQLVLVAHRRGAALEVADVGAFVGDDQRALELAGVGRVDAEVGRQLHRAAHALGDVDERAVGEDRRVQGGEEVVGVRDDRAQVLADQFGVLPHRLGERAEDDAHLGQFLLEGRGHRDAVEDRVDRDAGEHFLLLERNAQLLVGAEQLRVHFVEALRAVVIGLRRGVVDDGLVVDRRVVDVGPVGARSSSASGDMPPSATRATTRARSSWRRSGGRRPRSGPTGIVSCSMSVTKPHLYSWFASCSTVFSVVFIAEQLLRRGSGVPRATVVSSVAASP